MQRGAEALAATKIKKGGVKMLKTLRLLLAGLALALAIPGAAEAKTYYWISHGGPVICSLL